MSATASADPQTSGSASAIEQHATSRAAARDERPRVDVSVVLPTYNEVGHVAEEIRRIRAALDASDYSYEVVVVDDGSTDGTREVLRKIDGIHLIEHVKNLGSGGARRTGTRAARGDVVVWTDVDMTYPNDTIPALVDELHEHRYDQVVGARNTEEGTTKFLRVPAKWMIRRLAQYLVETEIPDLNSGFRAFRRDVAGQYLHRLPNGFSCVTTITMSFLADDYLVGYVPIDYHPRAGESKFHWYRDTRRYVVQVLRMVLSYSPLRVFGPVGMLLLALGFGKLLFDVVGKEFRLATNTLLIIFTAMQVLSIGLLADLVVRVNRPKDLIDR